MNPYLEVSQLDFSYGSQEILKEISFQVQRGSLLTILGPNGSGKSTLLKNISAALKPQIGTVYLNQQKIHAIRPKELAQKMAVVPQDTTVNFQFTVLDTVLMGRMPHQGRFEQDSEQDLAIAQWAMELTNTWHLKDCLITDISGGERQRVIVARALTQKPQVLLLDEPTAHLDLQHQIELLELLQKLTKTEELTVLAILHDLNLASQFSDYIILLYKKRIFAAGRPEEVLTAKNIRQVYGMEVVTTFNELTGRYNIVPVGRTSQMSLDGQDTRIHLICGGGTGAFLMEKLVQNGYEVSCGVLNVGDSDWSKAKSLGLEVVEEAPFTSIRQEIYEKNQALMAKAQVVILMPIPFGHGNLGNLLQAEKAAQEGKTVIVVNSDNFAARDFTGGKATKIYQRLIKNRVHLVSQPQRIFSLLAELKKTG